VTEKTIQPTPSPYDLPTIADIEASLYHQTRLRWGLRPVMLILLILVLGWLFMLNLSLGSVNIPREEVIRVLFGGEASRLAWQRIIWNFRLPKALTAALAGAALGVSGLQMQTFFRNPLAGPYVLGISSGASLGVALVVLSGATIGGTLLSTITTSNPFQIVLAASLGAGAVMLLVMMIARFVEGNITLLILGLMVGYMTNALVSLLLYFSIAEQIQAYINWTFGSFEGVTWSKLEVFGPTVLIGLGLAMILSKSLNALLLGEFYARTLGVNILITRFLIVFSSSILAGAVTAFCGPIGFLGLAVPHLCRSLFNTSDHRVLIPTTILMGANLALLSALIAEMPGQAISLPLNAVTALIGAPIVIWVVIARRNIQKSFTS
jgi:iron complex transport system permease protein